MTAASHVPGVTARGHAGHIGLRISLSADFDRTDTAQVILCFGGVGGPDDVDCWHSLGRDLLTGYDAAVVVTPDWNALLDLAGISEVETVARKVEQEVYRAAALCGLDIEVSATAGYSAGCDLALALGNVIDTVTRVLCVSGYPGGGSRFGCVYLALRRGRDLDQLRGLLRWRSRWQRFGPRAGSELILATAARPTLRQLVRTVRCGRGALVDLVDEMVARRATLCFVRRCPGLGRSVQIHPVTGHSWSQWRSRAAVLVGGPTRSTGGG